MSNNHYTPYHLIPRTLVFLFDESGRVLLLKRRADSKIFPGLFNGAGGHIEAGESPITSAFRELKEETGINAVHLSLCGILITGSTNQIGVIVFIFKGFKGKQEAIDQGQGQPEWMALREVHNQKLVQDLYELIPKVARWNEGDAILMGRSALEGESIQFENN
jgi:8-oxo-dGTP diphosphatase